MSALARQGLYDKNSSLFLVSSTNDSQQTSFPALAGQGLHDYQLVAAFNFPTLLDRLSAISCIPSKDLTRFESLSRSTILGTFHL